MGRHLFLILALTFVACASIQAQKQSPAQAPAKPPVEKTAAEIEAERVLKERRATAQSLLVNLAVDAGAFGDARVRARTQARIANLLWDSDRDRSRTMFRSAFDAAEVADAESWAAVQEDIRQQRARNPNGGYGYASPPDLRKEVVSLAAKRDAKLGEELLGRFKDQKAPEAVDDRRRPDLRGQDEGTRQRFDLAEEMLSRGDTPRAIQFADGGLSSINAKSMDFLAHLREKDAVAADQRYAAMLQNAAQNPQSDANTVALLASYIFSPNLFVTFVGNGAAIMQSGGPSTPPNLSPQLRGAFFRTGASILMRPLPDQSTAGPDGQYLSLKRMMPLFEQNASPEITAGLKAQLESLAAGASNGARNLNSEWMHRGIEPDAPKLTNLGDRPANDRPANDRPASERPPGDRSPTDREQTLTQQVETARDAPARDQANLQLALLMIEKDDRRAHDYVDKIDDMELRDATRAYVDMSIAWNLVSRRDVDRALEFARDANLTHLQRAWFLSQTARQIGVRDHERARPVLDDALTEARRIETGDPDRPRAFFAVANVVWRVNPAAVWETMADAITAANSADKFTGEDGQLAFRLNSKGSNSVHQHAFNDFDVAGIFTQLAHEDFDRTVALARGFQGNAPRANAVIAIANSVLDEKK